MYFDGWIIDVNILEKVKKDNIKLLIFMNVNMYDLIYKLDFLEKSIELVGKDDEGCIGK